jgi:hypothetical protein
VPTEDTLHAGQGDLRELKMLKAGLETRLQVPFLFFIY